MRDWWPIGDRNAFSAALEDLRLENATDRQLKKLLTDVRMRTAVARLSRLEIANDPERGVNTMVAPVNGSFTLAFLSEVAKSKIIWDEIKAKPPFSGNENEGFVEIRRSALQLARDLNRYNFRETYEISRLPGRGTVETRIQRFLEVLEWIANEDEKNAYGAHDNWLATKVSSSTRSTHWYFGNELISRKREISRAIAWFSVRYAAALWRTIYYSRVSKAVLATTITVLHEYTGDDVITPERVKYILRDDDAKRKIFLDELMRDGAF
jgi:hypothetical protein